MGSTAVQLPLKSSKRTDCVYCALFGKLIYFFFCRREGWGFLEEKKKENSFFLKVHFLFDWNSRYSWLYPVFAQQIIQK